MKKIIISLVVLCLVGVVYFYKRQEVPRDQNQQQVADSRSDSEDSGSEGSPTANGDENDLLDGQSAKLTPSPSDAGGQPDQKKSNYLNAEQKYLAGNALNMSGIGAAITQRNFSAVIDEFKKDAATEPDAQDTTKLYKSNFESILEGGDSIALSELACGLSICVGTMRANGKAGETQYNSWRDKLNEKTALPTYSFIDSPYDLGKGETEHRFFFSVDSGSNAFNVKR